jgi:Zn-dependent M16 (insulinase) family peptidase
MAAKRFAHFSELYRAAFAETNHDTKQLLLSEVKNMLNAWALDSGESFAESVAKPENSSATSPRSSTRAA